MYRPSGDGRHGDVWRSGRAAAYVPFNHPLYFNATGWSNADFDAACQAAQQAFYGSAEYVSNHQAALRLFAENVPVIPLFSRLKAAVVRPEVRNFNLDPTQRSELWNLFELDLVP